VERLIAPHVVLLYQWNHRSQDNVNEVISFCLSKGTDIQLMIVRTLCETDGRARGLQAGRQPGGHPIHVGEMKGLGTDF
jgi:hypothetical protein